MSVTPEARLLAAARDLLAEIGAGAGAHSLGLAISGGGDSMAMLDLVTQAAGRGWRIEAATVDHRLRPEAAEEAAFVARTCATLGIAHEVLVWDDHPATGNLMEQAAAARYRLLAGWAARRGIGHVALAHTADDQAETFLIGLSRAAGLDGLSGMRLRWQEGGVTFLRPFLGHGRAALRDHLRRRGLAWRDDPTNEDDRFTRARARKALHLLAPLGITPAALAETAGHLAQARALVQAAVAEAFPRIGREAAGGLILDRAGLAALAPELRRRLLVAALLWLSGERHPPRAAAVQRLQDAVAQGRDATLAGCRLRIAGPDLHLCREPRAAGGPVPAGMPWDGRWHLDGPAPPGAEIRALGAPGLRLCPDWRATGLPRRFLEVTPALWLGQRLIAAPCAGAFPGYSAKTGPDFAGFLLSH